MADEYFVDRKRALEDEQLDVKRNIAEKDLRIAHLQKELGEPKGLRRLSEGSAVVEGVDAQTGGLRPFMPTYAEINRLGGPSLGSLRDDVTMEQVRLKLANDLKLQKDKLLKEHLEKNKILNTTKVDVSKTHAPEDFASLNGRLHVRDAAELKVRFIAYSAL